MRVFGIDFTSNPTRTKRLTVAICDRDGTNLTLHGLKELKSEAAGDFSAFESWLKGEGEWAREEEWIAGLDFPFGMPIEAIEHFKWANCGEMAPTWSVYLDTIYRECDSATKFRESIEGWRHTKKTNEKGDPVRVRKQRLTDKLANSGSPMNYFPPPVCPMFYQGGKRLKDCPGGTSLIPVRECVDAKKLICESYPRLVANVFIDRQASYKDKSKKRHENKATQLELRRNDEASKREKREQILTGLASMEGMGRMQSRYGFQLSISEEWREECLVDNDGDKLDSVLCAVQAAWAWKTPHYGMPDFKLRPLRDQVQLEGWIADPIVLERLANGES